MGAGLGVFGALWLTNHLEKRTEKERKKKILRLLKHELLMNFGAFADWNRKEGKLLIKCTHLSVFLKSEYWKAFSDGGELQWLKDPILLSEIAEAYNFVRMMLVLSDRYFQLLQVHQYDDDSLAILNVTGYLLDGVQNAMFEIQKALNAIEKAEKQ